MKSILGQQSFKPQLNIQLTSPHGDLLRNHASADDGQPGADGVPNHTANDDAVHVLTGRQNDRGQLGPVAPLGQEGHRERLHQNSQQQVPRAALLVLADDARFGVLDQRGRRFLFHLRMQWGETKNTVSSI